MSQTNGNNPGTSGSMWIRDLTTGVCSEASGPSHSSSTSSGDGQMHGLSAAGHLSYVDFSPRMLEDCQLSSESVEATLGPKFEELDCLVKRANIWLQNHPNVRVVSSETVEYDTTVPGDKLLNNNAAVKRGGVKLASQQWVVVLRVLRLWVCAQSNLGNTALQRIAYITMVPDRLEVDPSQLIPKFEDFAVTTEKFRKRLHESPIQGQILSLETCELRMTHDNCEMNPDSTLFLGKKELDVYFLSYLRLFYTQGAVSREDVGFKDFIPARTSFDDNQTKGESCSRLMETANAWFRQQPNLHIINMQTLVCKMYPNLDQGSSSSTTTVNHPVKMDTTRSMFVQFPNKPNNFLIVLRVYYTHTTNFRHQHARQISYKTFLPAPGSDKRVHTPWSVTKTDMYKTLKKAAKWVQSTGAHIVGAETITISVPRTQRKMDIDNSRMVTEGTKIPGSRLLFAFRIYYEGCYQNNGMLTRALSMERLKINSIGPASASDQCAIL